MNLSRAPPVVVQDCLLGKGEALKAAPGPCELPYLHPVEVLRVRHEPSGDGDDDGSEVVLNEAPRVEALTSRVTLHHVCDQADVLLRLRLENLVCCAP